MDIIEYTENSELTRQNILADLTEKFIAVQDVKKSSKALYRRTLSQYFKWLSEKNYNLNQITRAEIILYKDFLLMRGMSSLSVGSYLTVVRKFYEWTEANKIYPNVAKGIKTPKRKHVFRKLPLSHEQIVKLLAYFNERSAESLRDYAIINLLLRTGLRTIEAVNANIEDITFKSGKRVLLVQGKGEIEKNNFVVLTEKAYWPIQEYLNTRPNVKSMEPIFSSISNNNHGKRLTTRTISRIAKDGFKAIGLNSKYITAHSLRHTVAVNILRAGGSITDAQGVLRHSNPATTQIYTKVIDEEIRIKRAPEELIENIF